LDKWGYKDEMTGEIIIQAKYDKVRSFEEGLAKVQLTGKWGFIDTTGKRSHPNGI
jgi:hypothetical protein